MPSRSDPLMAADETAWEELWAPHDQPTYQAVLGLLSPDDIVLEIGAGDLRLAVQMAKAAQRVYAIEIQESLLDQALTSVCKPMPGNLIAISGDACCLPFPAGITTGVLLMRHCTHFSLYINKLKEVGCQRLITNSRWRMGVELILLREPRVPFAQAPMGWYACWCGTVGFKPGPAYLFSPEQAAVVNELSDCPQCHPIGDQN